jgi:2-hydroxychromene-2-carboxylate isomerase
MGDVIDLAAHWTARRLEARGLPSARVELFFDLAYPATYLAAERVERSFAAVEWTPASAAVLYAGRSAQDLATAQATAARRAAQLRLPLAMPDRWPTPVPRAMRLAAAAATAGRGTAFVLAATRLAFGGGFDLEDPEILAEAAEAAGLTPEVCRAAADASRVDAAADATARRLIAAGVDRLPAWRVGRSLFCGEERLPEAAAAARCAC